MWSRHLAASTVRWLSRAAPALACAAVAATAPSCDRAFATGTLDHEPDASATPTRRSPALPAPLHASNVSGSDKYPVFTAEDVALCDGSESAPGGQMWVSIGRGVYDVTAFVHEHPGGARLLKDAVGGPVEGMWAYWAYHYHSAKVPGFLRKLRVGTLRDDDYSDEGPLGAECDDVVNMYVEDAPSARSQNVMINRPRNTQTWRWAMADEVVTPNSAFYIRNHAPVPSSGGDDHTLAFCSFASLSSSAETPCSEPTSVRLGDLLQDLPTVHITSVMQCCGNRARDMIRESGPTAFSGTPFEVIDAGMMGNAVWSGVRLRQVLLRMFPWLGDIDAEHLRRFHVHFKSKDGYASSTPLSRVLDPTCDALLATGMNGEPLPPHHGAPVRVVLPGIGGARNVKWVDCIEIHSHESSTPWNAVYYKDSASAAAPSIQQLPMQSLILSVADAQAVSISSDTTSAAHGGRLLPLQGIAWGGASGAAIRGVQVSCDGGDTWADATLLVEDAAEAVGVGKDGSSPNRAWGWTRWRADVALPSTVAAGDTMALACRATTEDGQQQPEATRMPGGYLYGGWHRTSIRLTK